MMWTAAPRRTSSIRAGVRALGALCLSHIVSAGGGAVSLISCTAGEGTLVCGSNSTVANATGVVEVRVTMETLAATEITVPGYRIVIDLPSQDEDGSMVPGFLPGADNIGMWYAQQPPSVPPRAAAAVPQTLSVGCRSIILGNLASIGLLLLFCGLAVFVEAKWKPVGGKQIAEAQALANEAKELAGIGQGVVGEEDDDDEDALEIGDALDGGGGLPGLNGGGGAASAGLSGLMAMRKGKKGGFKEKGAMMSMLVGAASELAHDPRVTEMMKGTKVM